MSCFKFDWFLESVKANNPLFRRVSYEFRVKNKQQNQDQLPWNMCNNPVQMWQAYLFMEIIILKHVFMTAE